MLSYPFDCHTLTKVKNVSVKPLCNPFLGVHDRKLLCHITTELISGSPAEHRDKALCINDVKVSDGLNGYGGSFSTFQIYGKKLWRGMMGINLFCGSFGTATYGSITISFFYFYLYCSIATRFLFHYLYSTKPKKWRKVYSGHLL